MINVNWDDNAKAAVETFMQWLDVNDDGKLELLPLTEKFMEEVVFSTQTKTVADAVEWADGEWKESAADCIVYMPLADKFSYYCGPFKEDRVPVKLVCTREQFEAYVKEQEGEKWTHTWKGDKCRVIFTEGASSWIKGHFINTIVHTESLKTIKPTISKAQAWDMLSETKCSVHEFGTKLVDLKKEYDII